MGKIFSNFIVITDRQISRITVFRLMLDFEEKSLDIE